MACQLVTAARSLALENNVLQGRTVQVSDFQLPAARQADDAPLWLRTDRISPLGIILSTKLLQSDGSGTLPVYVRIPPDLYFGDTTTLPLHLDYRYNAIPLAGWIHHARERQWIPGERTAAPPAGQSRNRC